MSDYVSGAIDAVVDNVANWLYTVCDASPELEEAMNKLEEVKELARKSIKDASTK